MKDIKTDWYCMDDWGLENLNDNFGKISELENEYKEIKLVKEMLEETVIRPNSNCPGHGTLAEMIIEVLHKALHLGPINGTIEKRELISAHPKNPVYCYAEVFPLEFAPWLKLNRSFTIRNRIADICNILSINIDLCARICYQLCFDGFITPNEDGTRFDLPSSIVSKADINHFFSYVEEVLFPNGLFLTELGKRMFNGAVDVMEIEKERICRDINDIVKECETKRNKARKDKDKPMTPERLSTLWDSPAWDIILGMPTVQYCYSCIDSEKDDYSKDKVNKLLNSVIKEIFEDNSK